jgi:hypothetical protein
MPPGGGAGLAVCRRYYVSIPAESREHTPQKRLPPYNRLPTLKNGFVTEHL